MNSNYVIDFNQNLELKLTRYIYPSDYAYLHNLFEKSEEILVIRDTLKYFFSEDFYYKNNSIIDTIEVKDLVHDYEEYGIISYEYVISPLENEQIKVFIDDQPVYLGNYIPSYYSSIDYKVNKKKQIKFIKRKS